MKDLVARATTLAKAPTTACARAPRQKNGPMGGGRYGRRTVGRGDNHGSTQFFSSQTPLASGGRPPPISSVEPPPPLGGVRRPVPKAPTKSAAALGVDPPGVNASIRFGRRTPPRQKLSSSHPLPAMGGGRKTGCDTPPRVPSKMQLPDRSLLPVGVGERLEGGGGRLEGGGERRRGGNTFSSYSAPPASSKRYSSSRQPLSSMRYSSVSSAPDQNINCLASPPTTSLGVTHPRRLVGVRSEDNTGKDNAFSFLQRVGSNMSIALPPSASMRYSSALALDDSTPRIHNNFRHDFQVGQGSWDLLKEQENFNLEHGQWGDPDSATNLNPSQLVVCPKCNDTLVSFHANGAITTMGVGGQQCSVPHADPTSSICTAAMMLPFAWMFEAKVEEEKEVQVISQGATLPNQGPIPPYCQRCETYVVPSQTGEREREGEINGNLCPVAQYCRAARCGCATCSYMCVSSVLNYGMYLIVLNLRSPSPHQSAL